MSQIYYMLSIPTNIAIYVHAYTKKSASVPYIVTISTLAPLQSEYYS